MRSPMKESKASGSTVQRVRRLIALGWFPGCRIRLLLENSNRRRSRVTPMEAGR